MNLQKVAIAGLLAAAGVILVLTVLPSKRESAAEGAEPDAARQAERPAVKSERRAEKRKPASGAASARAAQAEEQKPAETEILAPQPKTAGADAVAAGAAAREKAVKAWESLVDQMAAQKEQPPEESARRVKEAFDQLDKADQMDGIRRALNLFPDEQFPALYGILFDKAEDPDVLDAIFSDALNRPEELKNPLMRELRKDREHPMFFESARILDVVEPAEPKP